MHPPQLLREGDTLPIQLSVLFHELNDSGPQSLHLIALKGWEDWGWRRGWEGGGRWGVLCLDLLRVGPPRPRRLKLFFAPLQLMDDGLDGDPLAEEVGESSWGFMDEVSDLGFGHDNLRRH